MPIIIYDFGEIRGAFERVVFNFRNGKIFREAEGKIVNWVTKNLGRKYRAGITPQGNPWPKPTEVTLKLRKYKGFRSKKPGFEKGELYLAVLGKNKKLFRIIRKKNSVILRIRGKKAMYFDKRFPVKVYPKPGGSARGKHPAREFWFLSAEMIRYLSEVLLKKEISLIVNRELNRKL